MAKQTPPQPPKKDSVAADLAGAAAGALGRGLKKAWQSATKTGVVASTGKANTWCRSCSHMAADGCGKPCCQQLRLGFRG